MKKEAPCCDFSFWRTFARGCHFETRRDACHNGVTTGMKNEGDIWTALSAWGRFVFHTLPSSLFPLPSSLFGFYLRDASSL
jgi:hypothetical protein